MDPNFGRVRDVPKPAPAHYNPAYAYGDSAYAANYPAYGRAGPSGAYAPPAGPPPGQHEYVPGYDAAKLPDYEVGGYQGMKGEYKGGEDDARDIALERGNDPFADTEDVVGRVRNTTTHA